MYVLIGGAGMMGLGLAQQLLKLNHTVAIIDTDPLACRFAREKIGVMAFEGSAVSTTVLLEAGIKQANAVVAALRNDALNLAMITLSRSYGSIIPIAWIMLHIIFGAVIGWLYSASVRG